ncbi:hypothetical protein BH10ACI1_BH10ACI1_08030 [soil metagenome]
MKKFAVILFILTLTGIFCIAANAQTAWTGVYQFDEDGGQTAGGTQISIYHTIEVRETANGLMATIKSNGYQTSVDLICTAKSENNKLLIYFADYGEDNVLENFKEGDLLLTLEAKNENEVLTFWGKFQPSIEKNEKSGKVYFVKSKVLNQDL